MELKFRIHGWIVLGLLISAFAAIPTAGAETTTLTSGIPVAGSLDAGEQANYTIAVPEGATSLVVEITGATGDLDLYVRFNQPPTTDDYDFRPYQITGNEKVTVDTSTKPAITAGTWYVMIDAYEASPYTLTATVSTSGGSTPSSSVLTSGVPVSGEVAKGEQDLYTIVLTDTANKLVVKTTGTISDLDLYLRFGEAPTRSRYDYRPYLGYGDETIEVTPASKVPIRAGTWYVMVDGYEGGRYTLTAFVSEARADDHKFEVALRVTGVGTPARWVVVSFDGEPVAHAEVLVNGRTVGYTDEEGSLQLYEGVTISEIRAKANINGVNYEAVWTNDGSGSGDDTEEELPPNVDTDNDGLMNYREQQLGTDPRNPDTDSDHLWDGYEVQLGTDPKSNQYAHTTTHIPWSGYWWPLANRTSWTGRDNTNLYDKGGPLDKYDQYVLKTRGTNPGAREWEEKNNGYPVGDIKEATFERDYGRDVNRDGDMDDPYDYNHDGDTDDSMDASWWGHCHAFGPAGINEDEPTEPITREGITFTVGDLKGLLWACYDSTSADFFVGDRCNDAEKEEAKLKDVTAGDFHKVLLQWIATKDTAIVCDIVATEAVWNYPLYAYTMSERVDSSDPTKVHYTVTARYADDGVQPDFVGTESFTIQYTYWLKIENGRITGGGWEGRSADERTNNQAHPDFMWHPGPRPGVKYGCPLKYEIVKEILGRPPVPDNRGPEDLVEGTLFEDALMIGPEVHEIALTATLSEGTLPSKATVAQGPEADEGEGVSILAAVMLGVLCFAVGMGAAFGIRAIAK